MTLSILKKILIGVSFIIYSIACFLPVLVAANDDNSYSGFGCLIFGAMSILYNISGFIAWLANIPYVIALLTGFFNKLRFVSFIFSIFSLTLTFFTFGVTKIMINEGGNQVDVDIGVGFYVWLFSFFILFIANFLGLFIRPKQVEYQNPGAGANPMPHPA